MGRALPDKASLVSVPRFHLPTSQTGALLALPTDAAHHAFHVLRLRSGSAVRAFDGHGHEYDASIESATAKTKEVVQIISRIAPKGKILVVDAVFAPESARATRNIERVSMQVASKLNALDLAQYKKIIVSSAALETIIARVNGGKS